MKTVKTAFSFKKCTMEEFTKKGLPESQAFLKRLCPNFEGAAIKNVYSSSDRDSFAMEVVACSDDLCPSEKEIESVLNELYFTVYVVQRRV